MERPVTSRESYKNESRTEVVIDSGSVLAKLAEERTNGGSGSALRASEGRFRAMFEGSPIGTALLDLEARYVAINPALQTMLGYTDEELLGQYVWAHYPDKSSEAPMAYLDKLLNGTTESYRREQRYIRKDGQEIFAQLTAALLRDEKGNAEFGLCMLEDITERKQLEAQLRQAQKMEAVGQFAGGIAHDFNNTLSTISAYAQILFDDLTESDSRRNDASEILKAASRAAGLTRQLLTFSRKKALSHDLLDVCTVVEEFGALLRPLLPASIRLITHIAQRPLTIRVDRTQFEQILMNLALNARDAMPNGGSLTIEIAQCAPSEHAARNSGNVCTEAFAALMVSDTGVGISDDIRCRLFEPFFTTKGDVHGTGLGLATVYAIARQGGGAVAVDSTPGEGSRFTVTLPIASGTAAAVADPCQSALPESRDSCTTVLIAEDEASVREAARRLLQRAGLRVLTACNGVEALEALNGNQEIDVLMTDMMMPIMGGTELIALATALRPNLRVIVISGYSDIGESNRRVPGDIVLEKPFSADSLIRAVRQVTASLSKESE
jgi:two-component system cell cycle sensor histidine kinase/response regulator CckA